MAITPLYERTTLDTVHAEFIDLIRRDCDEEELQKYISEHPVLLAPFHPSRVFYKTPILSKYKTDITILTRTGGLLLIELERADKRLLTKSGEPSSQLQHALTQVRDWLHEFGEHRLAALDCLGIDTSEVVTVDTLVIAGRDRDHDAKRLRWLKGVDHGRHVKVWTYDDLLHAFEAVTRSMGTL